MSAGQLNERVDLVRITTSQNEYGTLVDSESVIATVWARVHPMSGRERDRASQTESRANYSIRIRNTMDLQLTEKDAIRWRGFFFNIRFVPIAGPREQFLDIECERGAPQ